jgi:tryptophanyl-tRNA synthetase
LQGVKDDAGPEFYHMPKTVLTPELKRDLQLLRMRSVISLGKQHFKKDSRRDMVPQCAWPNRLVPLVRRTIANTVNRAVSQVGRIIEGNTDGYQNRLSRKERKRTIVEEVLAGDTLDKFKSKYNTIQEHKMSGKKGHYKKLVARRRRNG